MSRRFIGIDPGITGGFAVLSETGRYLHGARTPVIPPPSGKGRKLYDVPTMRDLLKFAMNDESAGYAMCGIEKVASGPGEGAVGAFSFGRGLGLWHGLLSGLGIPYVEVRPQAWQAKMLAGHPRGKAVKQSAVSVAKSRWPSMDLKVKLDWGIADAALIAEFTRKIELGL